MAGVGWKNILRKAVGSGPLVVGTLPGRVRKRHRRAELLGLLSVPPTGPGPTVTVVTGLRGAGKSQLVAEYARECAAGGWQVVAWVDAGTAGGLAAGLAALSSAAGREPAPAVAWLCAQPGPCLLVFDDVRDPGVVRDLLPRSGRVHTVITTVRPELAGLLGVSPVRSLTVGPFDQADAVRFLQAQTRHNGDAAALAEQLGGLPLALVQATDAIRSRSYGQLVEKFQTAPLDELLPKSGGDPYQRGTAEAIRCTLEELTEAHPSGFARELLDLLAVLAPTGVDASLFAFLTDTDTDTDTDADADDRDADDRAADERAADERDADDRDADDRDAGDRDAEDFNAEDFGAEDFNAEDCADTLVDWSLVNRSGDGLLTVHPLVRLVTLQDRAGELDDVLVHAAERIETAASEPGARWHTRAVLADLARHAQALGTHRAGDAARLTVAELQRSMLVALCNAGASDTATEFATAMSADATRIAGEEDVHALNILGMQILSLSHAGRTVEGTALGERVAARFDELAGPEHPDALTAWLHLANNHWMAGRTDTAIEIAERVHAAYLANQGEEDAYTLKAAQFLGDYYTTARRLDDAIALHTRNLAACERALGPDQLRTVWQLNALASVYAEAGRPKDAIAMLRRSIPLSTRHLGAEHPQTLGLQNSLAAAYRASGSPAEAIELYTSSLETAISSIGPDHPTTVLLRTGLDAVREQGHPDRTG